MMLLIVLAFDTYAPGYAGIVLCPWMEQDSTDGFILEERPPPHYRATRMVPRCPTVPTQVIRVVPWEIGWNLG